MFFNNIGSFFVKLGRSLMLPIAVLPIAGILLRIGQPDLLNIAFISVAGSAVFDNLPIIFAIGVAIGFSNDNHGSVALAAFVGHAIFLSALKTLLPDVNMGVLSGIIIGIIAGVIYNRYKSIELPTYLAFFGGRRFIPIATGLASLLLALAFNFVWPPLGYAISALGNWIIESGNLGLFVYGIANKLLLPIGLHHVVNSLVWFQFGEYSVIENGVQVIKHGDLWRFFAGDPTAGAFMAIFFPIMMFGLPGGALAMLVLAKSNKRKIAAGILVSAALTSFLTGITEPLEFSFMFLAYPLYLVHAVLTGISGVVMNMLNVKLGFTFSAGAFDYLLSYGISTHPLYLIPIGLIYFALYFVIFYSAIKFWDLKTIGREDDDKEQKVEVESGTTTGNTTATSSVTSNVASNKNDIAEQYIIALGGRENIKVIDCCTTRLRLTIVDNKVINVDRLRQLGAKGVINSISGSLQVIIGPEVELLAEKIKKAM